MRVFRTLLWLAALMVLSGAAAESLLCVSAQDTAALLNGDGAEIISPGLYDDIFCLRNGSRYAVGIDGGSGMKYAMCDASGTLLTEFGYSMLAASGEVILFRNGNMYGAMDQDGRILMHPQFTQLTPIRDGKYFAVFTDPFDDEPDVIWIVAPGEELVSTGIMTLEGLSTLQSDRMPFRSPDTERCGYLDGAGNIAVEASLSYAGSFENGIARAAVGGKFGLLTPEGGWLVPPQYEYLEVSGDAVLVMPDAESCAVLNASDGSERFRPKGKCSTAQMLGDKLACVEDGRLKVYDMDGVLLLDTSPDASVSEGAGGELILREGDWGAACVGIVGADGSVSVRRDQHLLALDEKRYIFMKMNVAAYNSGALGEIRYSCDYDSIRFGIVASDGEEILPATALEIRRLAEYRYLIVSGDGLRVVDDCGTVLWARIAED